jgi:hypothetical protein
MKRFLVAALAIVALVVFSSAAAAQEQLEYKVTVKGEVVKGSSSDHFVTFSGPVHVPDATLPAGTYVFRFLSPSLVQVSSADRSQHYAMFFTAPIFRAETSEAYEMTLARTVDTAPQRIAGWFLPNQSLGYEFIYPKREGLGAR